MTKTIEVEIDDHGTVRPMDPAASLPHGRALLVWQTETMRRSQASTHPSEMVIADNGLAFFPANGRVLTPEMVKATQEDIVSETMLLSEASLAADWLKPEENEAWAYMQPDR